MAVQIDFISIMGLRKAHLSQLLGYIEHIDEEGVYWGNEKQFKQRHKDLHKWLQDWNTYIQSPEVKIRER